MKSAERLKKWEEFVVCVSDSSSTQDSKYCPREEILQSKGRLYQLHKEKMKKEQEKEVMALATFHPEINSRYESKEKVETRLLRYGLAKSSRLEKKRRESAEKTIVSVKKISQRTDSHERLYNMKKVYDKKIEEQQIKKFEDEKNTIKPPQICKKSEEIVQKLNRPEKIEERLQVYLKKSGEYQESLKEIENISAKVKGIPQITSLAKGMKRLGTITDRLTRYKDYYDSNLKALQEKYHPEAPVIRPRSSSAARERLTKPKSRSQTPEKYSFKPNLSPYSLKLAANLEKSSSRLLKSPSFNQIDEKNCSFSPSINSLSLKLDNRKKMPCERWESLYQLKDLHKEKINNIIENTDMSDPECTFKPLIKASRENSTPSTFVDRVNGWKEMVKEKVTQKRDLALEEDLRKCTFSPDIQPLKCKKKKKELDPYEKKDLSYSKKYQHITADEFLSAVQALHHKLHSDV